MTNAYSKLAASSILITMLYIAWLLLVIPYMDTWEDSIRGVEILQRKHIALSRMINNRQELDRQYLAINSSRELQEVFLNNKTGALADVKLQRIIKQVVTSGGGKLIKSLITTKKTGARNKRSTQAASDKSVTVNVLMQGSIKSIYTTLHKLENSRPLILVRNLEIIHNRSRYQITETTENTFYRAKFDATAFIL